MFKKKTIRAIHHLATAFQMMSKDVQTLLRAKAGLETSTYQLRTTIEAQAKTIESLKDISGQLIKCVEKLNTTQKNLQDRMDATELRAFEAYKIASAHSEYLGEAAA